MLLGVYLLAAAAVDEAAAEFALLQNAQVLYVVSVDGVPLVDVLQIHPGGEE